MSGRAFFPHIDSERTMSAGAPECIHLLCVQSHYMHQPRSSINGCGGHACAAVFRQLTCVFALISVTPSTARRNPGRHLPWGGGSCTKVNSAKSKPWVSGGSAASPRIGTCHSTPTRSPHRMPKHGTALFTARGPRGQTVPSLPYVAQHQIQGSVGHPILDAAVASKAKLFYLTKMPAWTLVTHLRKTGHIIPLKTCGFCNKGRLARLGTMTKHHIPVQRCRARDCRRINNVHPSHPIFLNAEARATCHSVCRPGFSIPQWGICRRRRCQPSCRE